jgi:hypothetical protein
LRRAGQAAFAEAGISVIVGSGGMFATSGVLVLGRG